MNRKQIGDLGEKAAQSFLKKKGYRILETNHRCRDGEIDVIARKKDFLVFVEVRTKTSAAFGFPEESITLRKKEKLLSLAQLYITQHDTLPSSWRIDFVGVELTSQGNVRNIALIENAIY